MGKGIANLIERTLTNSMDGKPDQASFDQAVPIYERCYREVNGRHTTIYPGVMQGLAALRERGFPLACVTNKSERFTLPLLEYMKMSHYFVDCGCGRYLAAKKTGSRAAVARVQNHEGRAARDADDRRFAE